MITLTDRSLFIPQFHDIIYRLQLKGYSVEISNIESNSIFILFNNIYVFNSIPQGFEIMESAKHNCKNCFYSRYCIGECNNHTEPVTIIINSEVNSSPANTDIISNLTTKQINERLQELAEWVTKVNLAIFGRANILATDKILFD